MDINDVKTQCSSLEKVADIFQVPVSTVRVWRNSCKSLATANKPYNLANIAMDLMVNKLMSVEDVVKIVGYPLAMACAEDAIRLGKTERMLQNLNVEDFVDGDHDAAMTTAFKVSQPLPLLATETAVIAIASPRTAALFVDRVWTIDPETPSEIEFDCGSAEETVFRGIVSAAMERVLKAKYGVSKLHAMFEDDERFRDLEQKQVVAEQAIAPALEKALCVPIERASGRVISPFMSSGTGLSNLHKAGEYEAIAVTIRSMNLVDESKLTWGHVAQFRSDKEARKKLKRFLHWIDGTMAGKPLSYVSDELSLRMEDYEKTLKSWGITTALGAFGAVVDAKTWMSIFAASMATTSAALSLDVTATVGLAVLGLKVTHEVLKINYEEKLRREKDEIAYLYDVKLDQSQVATDDLPFVPLTGV